MATPTCAGESIPVVRLALVKERCARVKAASLTTPQAVGEWLVKHYGCQPQENFLGVFLNPKMEVIAVQEVTLGALDAVSVDPRVIFSAALLAGATAMIIAHNHPSGNPEPSAADFEVMRLLSAGAKLLGIQFIDSLVLGRGGAMSSMMHSGIRPPGVR